MKKGQLIRGKTPLAVLEVACSWELTPIQIAAEVQRDINVVYRAIDLLRRKGYVEDKWPRRQHRPVIATQAGRDAVKVYGGGR